MECPITHGALWVDSETGAAVGLWCGGGNLGRHVSSVTPLNHVPEDLNS
ncbi:hypothetical protein BH10ACT2_BH10ACT2_06150 [soil metagenome]